MEEVGWGENNEGWSEQGSFVLPLKLGFGHHSDCHNDEVIPATVSCLGY